MPKGEWMERVFPMKRTNAAGRLRMRLFRDEKGQTLVLTALLGCCLMGFMALAIDVGVLFRAQRRLQIAADSAAIAGSLAFYYNQTVTGCGTGVSSITCAAYKAAANNGVTDTSQIAVHNPPWSGSHGGSEYVEVVINQPNPTLFMATFNALMPGGSSNSNSMTVGARAVGGIVPSQLCAYALDPHAKGSMEVQGSASVNMPGCVLQINSDSNQALCTTGGATVNDPAGIRIVGAQNPSGPCNGTQGNATTGVGYAGDPFAGLAVPTCSSANEVSATTITSTTPLLSQTQTAPNGSTASVVCFKGTNVVIAGGTILGSSTANPPQIFVFEHGVNVGGSGSGSMTINGTIMVMGGNYAQANTALTLNAPTSGTYNAIAIWVPSTNTSISCDNSVNSFKGDSAPGGACLQIQFGSGGTSSLDGMIYAPGAQVYMQDHGGASLVTTIIADEIFDKSSDLTITNYNVVHGATSPLVNVALVE
jgi:Flp pilus assembly protein TadG